MSNELEPEYESRHRSATFRPELISPEIHAKMKEDRRKAENESGSVRCDCCGAMFVDEYGDHSTLKMCDSCTSAPNPVDLTDIDETHWTETHGTMGEDVNFYSE